MIDGVNRIHFISLALYNVYHTLSTIYVSLIYEELQRVWRIRVGLHVLGFGVLLSRKQSLVRGSWDHLGPTLSCGVGERGGGWRGWWQVLEGEVLQF